MIGHLHFDTVPNEALGQILVWWLWLTVIFAVPLLVLVMRDRWGKGFWTVILTLMVGLGFAVLGGFIGVAVAAVFLRTNNWVILLAGFAGSVLCVLPAAKALSRRYPERFSARAIYYSAVLLFTPLLAASLAVWLG